MPCEEVAVTSKIDAVHQGFGESAGSYFGASRVSWLDVLAIMEVPLHYFRLFHDAALILPFAGGVYYNCIMSVL